jgi:hypothetical protein
MVVGFWNGSDSDIAGSSSGKPPAWSTPRLMSSTRSLKCAWHRLMSDQVPTTATAGLPASSSGP